MEALNRAPVASAAGRGECGVLGVMKRLANRTLLQSFLFDSSMTRNSGLYEAERPIVGTFPT